MYAIRSYYDDNNTLPLNKNSKIALIGPSVNDQFEMFSMWSQTGDRQSVVTIFVITSYSIHYTKLYEADGAALF